MSIIRIISNGIELDYVRESLSIKRENNAFISQFKVSYSTYPFLIIENQKTAAVLGTRDLTSVLKTRIVPVVIYEMGEKFYGELEILTYLKGYRKCNLKFGTELLTIINKKIGDFMPTISITSDSEDGSEGDIVQYTEQSAELVPGYTNWETYPFQFLDKVFPQVKWQFPMIKFVQFQDDVEETDEWFYYRKYLNYYRFNENQSIHSFAENIFILPDPDTVIVYNKNIPAPQVFLLAPLYYAFSSLGWKLKGDFINHSLIRRILILSTAGNLSRVIIKPTETNIIFESTTWIPVSWESSITTFQKKQENTDLLTGNYTCRFRFVLPAQTSTSAATIKTRFQLVVHENAGTDSFIENIIVFTRNNNTEGEVIEGEFTFDSFVDGRVVFYYYSISQQMPLEYSILVSRTDAERPFQMMHPTIQFSRFVPEWTLGDFINQLKNTFNLDITLNEESKEAIFNFTDDIFLTEIKEKLLKSCEISSYDAIQNDAFVIKHENEEDNFLYISKSETTVNKETTSTAVTEIKNKFKFIPFSFNTAELTEEIVSKSGVGLIIYDPLYKPFISETYADKTLKIEGAGGIHETFWKKTLKVRLNASGIEIKSYFTETEITKISKSKRVYFDNQAYIVLSYQYNDTEQENYNVTLKLESISI